MAGLAANVGLVSLDDPLEHSGVFLDHRGPDALLHVQGRLLCQVEIAGELRAADGLLGVDHQGDGQKPLLERNARLAEDGAGENVEAGVAIVAVPPADSLAVRLAGDGNAPAARAGWRLAPTDILKVLNAGLLRREAVENLDQVHVGSHVVLSLHESYKDRPRLSSP